MLFRSLVDLIGRKWSRVDSLAAASILGVIAYSAMFFIIDPLGPQMLGVMALLAIAQIFGIIASQVFITQQARAEIRGSVIGFFGVCGAFAQIVLAYLGGFLFDKWSPTSPFLLVAALNLILLIACLALRSVVNRGGAEDTGETVKVV